LEEIFNVYDVVVLDEFPNWIKENKEISVVLQKLIDTSLQFKNKKLIVCGSLLSFMKGEIMSYKSPLYGKKTLSMQVKPLKFADLREFFPSSPLQRLVGIYGIAGGVPYYLKLLPQKGDVVDYINSDLKKKGSWILQEADFLLKYEFRETRKYKLILEAIALGKNTVNEIKNYTYFSKTEIMPYLHNLKEVGLIKKILPFPHKSKKNAHYFIADNFMSFWFRFIHPNLSYIEEGTYHLDKKDYYNYLGNVFKDIAKQLLIDLKPINFNKIGTWWHKDKEIDIIAINEETEEMLAVEVKWQDLKLRDVKSIIEELHEKLPYVQWENDKRKEILGIFGKRIEKKARKWLVSHGYKAWDLEDIKKIRKRKTN